MNIKRLKKLFFTYGITLLKQTGPVTVDAQKANGQSFTVDISGGKKEITKRLHDLAAGPGMSRKQRQRARANAATDKPTFLF